MEHKKWSWKRKKSEAAACQKGVAEKAAYKQQDLDKSLKCLDNALISSISETNAKDDLLEKQTKAAQEALSGWEKAKAEVDGFKRELNDGLREKEVFEERLAKLDAELEESTEQYRVIVEERDQMAVDIAARSVKERESKEALEEKLSTVTSEKENLIAVVKDKEKMVEDLNELKSEVDENLKVVVARLDLSEKCNASLRYEVCMLEKEVQIRNEERDFNLKSVDVAQKRHVESAKKIAELEAECQKLRVMVRKRLPGPAALKGMKSQVEMIGMSGAELQRKRSNTPAMAATQRLHLKDKENELLKEEIRRKNKELELLREMHAISSSKLCEIQKESSSGERGGQRSPLHTRDNSWASALISELDYFRNAKLTTASPSCKTSVSDLNLTNDFVDIEKSLKTGVSKPTENGSHPGSSESSSSMSAHERKNPIWLKDILRVVLEAKSVTQKDVDVILEEVRNACIGMGHYSAVICDNYSTNSSQKSSNENSKTFFASHHQNQPNLEVALCKLIHLVEKIGESSFGDGDFARHNGSSPSTISGYFSRVFDWDCSERRHVLQSFIQGCNDLLHVRINLEEFVSNTTDTLNWSMIHSRPSSSLQDASRTEEKLDSEGSQIANLGGGLHSVSEVDDDETESDNHRKQSSKVDVMMVHSETKKIPGTDEKLNADDQPSDTEPILVAKTEFGRESPLRLPSSEADSKVETISYPETEDCLQLHLPVESEVANNQDMDQVRNPHRTTLEMYAASEKLAECQETITNLGKQLKDLASKNALISNKVVSSTSKTIHHIALPLRDQLQAICDDDKSEEQVATPVTKEIICTTGPQKRLSMSFSKPHLLAHEGGKSQLTIGNQAAPVKLEERLNAMKGEKPGSSHAIVHMRQKSSVGLWRKLFLRRKMKESKRLMAIAS